jgi:beta-N-acetylhexosaminidase
MAKKNKKQKSRWTIHEKIFLVLIVIVLVLATSNVAKARGWLIPEPPVIEIIDNTVILDSMSLEQKIAQMVIVHGGLHNLEAWKNIQPGGIHFFAMKDESLFSEIINKFQFGMQIPFFVTADLEGCWSPFMHFKNFTSVNEISDVGEAFKKGTEEGKYLKQLGFNLNFAPVVDLKDEIWKCRTFPGDEKQITELAEAYILGLQNQGVIATAKHYPGKTLIAKDPHKELVIAEIGAADQYPYEYLADKGDVKAAMVTHIIAYGNLVDSEGYPSVVSEKAVGKLKSKYGGLIITDDTMMLGLRKFFNTMDEMYLAVFKAGNDLVINFNEDPNEIYRMIQVVKEAVESGEIPEEQIDNSVRKILEAKGFTVG